MVIVVACIVAALTVPLAGGRFARVAELELRHTWAVVLAIAVQVATFSVAPGALASAGEHLHFASYALAGAFLVANRHIPGLWLVGVGGASNLAAITANGGVMPASPSALDAAGLAAGGGAEFANSAAVASPHLAVLGDVCVVAGLFVVLHVICGSRLVPAESGQFRALLRERRFARVWGAQAVSNLGDFAYSLAVGVTVVERGQGVGILATVLVVQALGGVVTGLLGGALVDRFSRRRLMIATDVARCAAVASLLLAGTPTPAHLIAVAACLGVAGALFQPALHASLPNLVRGDLLVAVNALVSATFHISVLVGPVLGGLLAARYGVEAAFALNAASFAVSAALLCGARIPQARTADAQEPPLAAIREGLTHVARRPLLRVMVGVSTAAMFAASLKQPVEPGFLIDVLGGATRDIGLATAAWGLGMVLGSALAPSAARHWARERLIAVALGCMGGAVAAAGCAAEVAAVTLLWLAGGG